MKIFNQNGIALSEFIIVGPLIIFIGLAAIQYALIYNARMNLGYAAYEAARAGAIHNADPAKIEDALYKGLIPYFSTTGIRLPGDIHIESPFKSKLSTSNKLQLATGGYLLKETIKKTESAFMGVHMVNPSKASFEDWSDDTLSKVYKIKSGVKGMKIIPNRNIDIKGRDSSGNLIIGKKSKQTLQDANVLKLRITYGYEPRIPLMKNVFSAISAFFGSQRDAVSARILAAGRIPIVVDISSQMLSPAIQGGLSTTVVNRKGFLINQSLVDKMEENKSMQWQVGRQDESLENMLINDAEKDLMNSVENSANNSNVTAASIGSSIKDSVVGSLTGVAITDGQTGTASSETNEILGDMNGLISCSNGTAMDNFY